MKRKLEMEGSIPTIQEVQIRTISLLGVNVHAIMLDQLIDFIVQSCLDHHKAIVAYVNIYSMNLAYHLSWFRDFLNACDRVFCDGFGVKWAAQFLYRTDMYRCTPPDWIPLLARKFARHHLTMYFLGAKPGITEKAAAELIDQTPGLKVVGMHHGYFDKSSESGEQQAIIDEINRLRPNLLVLGFGMPAQERWIMDHWTELDVDVALPAGALFDYMAGEVYRAPLWMTDHGLEWLGRLLIEPRRLWKRYLVGNPLFVWRVLIQKMKQDKQV